MTDRAGKAYWDELWSRQAGTRQRRGGAAPLDNHVDIGFARLLRNVIGKKPRGSSVLEVGCADSPWLPYFANDLGMVVTGIDYSERGCEQARRRLAEAGAVGRVVCADAFSPPSDLLGAFDVVASFGVVEHFDDTAACIRAFARFLADGGTMITVVPNLCGAIGLVQRLVNPRVYDLHVALTPGALASAHARAGLDHVRCGYFLTTNFGVNNVNGLDPAKPSTRAKSVLLRGLVALSQTVWLVERHAALPATKALSPYVVCVAQTVPRA